MTTAKSYDPPKLHCTTYNQEDYEINHSMIIFIFFGHSQWKFLTAIYMDCINAVLPSKTKIF